MMARFEKRETKPGTFKIRDTEGNDGQGKWAMDGNGRQIRSEDEERTDRKVEELNKRADEAK
jgi:hypothetical protein